MFIAMNRFKVSPGQEAAFETLWTSRDSFLHGVPGFVEFHLLRGPVRADHVLYSSHTIWADHASFAMRIGGLGRSTGAMCRCMPGIRSSRASR